MRRQSAEIEYWVWRAQVEREGQRPPLWFLREPERADEQATELRDLIGAAAERHAADPLVRAEVLAEAARGIRPDRAYREWDGWEDLRARPDWDEEAEVALRLAVIAAEEAMLAEEQEGGAR